MAKKIKDYYNTYLIHIFQLKKTLYLEHVPKNWTKKFEKFGGTCSFTGTF